MTTEWKDSVYPVSLDDFDPKLNDGVDHILANHPNSLATSIETIQQKLGIDGDPVTGVGGVEFKGVSNNPGAAGKSCLWTDNAGNLNFTDTGSNASQILLKPDVWTVAGDAFTLAAEDAGREVRTAVFTETWETYGGVAGVSGVSADAEGALAGVYNALEGDPGGGYAAFVRMAAGNYNGAAEFELGVDNTGDAFAELWTSQGGWLVNQDGFFIATPNNNEIAIDDEDNQDGLETESQSIVGAINELHRPVIVIEAELSPDGNNPATVNYTLPVGWYICSFVKAEKISGDASAVTVRLLDGANEVYKHAGPGDAGNDLDTEDMQDRNVFSMEMIGGNLTIEADSPAACVVKITLRVRAE
jgi:hypothetical protein